jgi:hypothetical protein
MPAVKMSNHMCTTIFCSLVVFVLPATYAQVFLTYLIRGWTLRKTRGYMDTHTLVCNRLQRVICTSLCTKMLSMRCKIDTRGNPINLFHELHPAQSNINPITRPQLQDEPDKATDDDFLQNLQDWEPLQGGPDATFRGNVSVVSLQDLSLSKGSRPDATALAATARSAEGTLSNLVARDLGAGLQGQIAHTDVMPSGILGWPPKQTALAPSPSANDTQPGANGAKDYVPAPSPDPYQACSSQVIVNDRHSSAYSFCCIVFSRYRMAPL